MKVAIITNHPGGNAGCEKMWIRVASRFIDNGHIVGVSMEDGEEPKDPTLLSLIKSDRFSLHRRGWKAPVIHQRLLNRLGLKPISNRVQQTVDWLSNFSPDAALISQSCNVDGAQWMTECNHLEIPFVTIAQSAAESIWPIDKAVNELKVGYESAYRNFFVSEKNLQLTSDILGCPVPHAEVCSNAFQIDYDIALEWPEANGCLRMACVGRLHPSSKGQDILLRCLADERWRERDYHLTLYGDGPNRQAIERLIESLDLLETVTLGGFLSPSEIWAKEQVLVLPSRYEGKPLAIIEALLSGRVCVTTDVAGNAEYITDGETGFVSPHASVADFSEALERVWGLRNSLAKIGQAAAKNIRNRVGRNPELPIVKDLTQSAGS